MRFVTLFYNKVYHSLIRVYSGFAFLEPVRIHLFFKFFAFIKTLLTVGGQCNYASKTLAAKVGAFGQNLSKRSLSKLNKSY